MRCPSCGADVPDDAQECPECGHRLIDEAGATKELPDLAGSDATDTLTGSPAGARLEEARSELRRKALLYGWVDAAAGAGVAFLGLLCVGSVLLVGAKLEYPRLGTESSPFGVLTAIVMLGLAVLGSDVEIDNLEISVIPLGALAVAGAALAWSASSVVARRDARSTRDKILEGAKIGIPFGLICMLAALLFRLPGDTPVSVQAWDALWRGTSWGVLFGALGGARGARRLGEWTRDAGRRAGARSPAMKAGLLMLATTLAASLVVTMLWVVIGLVRGQPADLDAGSAVTALIYFLAFLPNAVVIVASLSVGAVVDVGAQIGVSGRLLGPQTEVSLWQWGTGGTPWYLFALLLIPVASAAVGGTWLRSRTPSSGPLPYIGAGALLALSLCLLVILSDARLGAGIVRNRGLAVIEPRPLGTLLLAFLWGAGGAYAASALPSLRGRPTDAS